MPQSMILVFCLSFRLFYFFQVNKIVWNLKVCTVNFKLGKPLACKHFMKNAWQQNDSARILL